MYILISYYSNYRIEYKIYYTILCYEKKKKVYRYIEFIENVKSLILIGKYFARS